MKFLLRSLTLSLSGFLAFFPTLGFALNQPVMFEPNQAFPLTPRVTGLGMAGDDELVWGDMMLPLAGNHNQVWYVDVQAKTAFDSDWLGSVGTGARKVFNDNSIWGAYVFVDRNVSPDSNLFWFVSPGIEELGNWFDFRANGYFPTNTKQQYGSTDWADNFGVYDYVSFQGHTQYDILMTQDEEVGWGYDAEIGAKIPGLRGTRAYVGGYHFGFDSASDINGVEGRVELPVNRYLGLTVRDSYDNEQHNTILVGLKITLGGVNANPTNQRQAIQERILDPIERNFATLGQGVGEPVQEVLVPASASNPPNPPVPPPMVERDNIWFFSETGTDTFTGSIENCTMENVCIDSNFNQDTVNGINALKLSSSAINNRLFSSPSFYLAPGTYSSLDSAGTGPLQLTNDWIWGKSANFVTEELRTLTGAMIFNGNANRLNTILLQSNGSQDLGVLLKPNSVLLIENSQIGSPTDMAGATYHTAIEADNANLTITDYLGAGGSTIRAYSDDGLPVVGIVGTDSRISINNSSVLAASDFTPMAEMPFAQSAKALSLAGSPLVAITGSTIMAEATWNGSQLDGFSTMATGIFTNTSTITIENSRVEADATIIPDPDDTQVRGNNLASAIGANSVGEAALFQGNNIAISGSLTLINANAITEGRTSGINAAVGIGENMVNVSAADVPVRGNVVTMNTLSHINSIARVEDDLNGTAANLSAAIGNNGVNAINAVSQDNEFTLDQAELISSAQVEGLTNGNAFNMAVGIGGNAIGTTDASFESNKITLENNTSIRSTAGVQSNQNVNFAIGLGGNAVKGATANFADNKSIALDFSRIAALAEVSVNNDIGSNFAAGMGGNASLINGNASFKNNALISITGGSSIIGTARVTSNFNSTTNMAVGLGGNASNSSAANFEDNKNMMVTGSTIDGDANIIFLDSSSVSQDNFAVGLGGNAISLGDAFFDSNVIAITSNSNISGFSQITLGGAVFNYAVGLGGNPRGGVGIDSTQFTNTPITIVNSSIEGTAKEDLNSNTNRARGLSFQGGSSGTVSISGLSSFIGASTSAPGTNQATGIVAGASVTVTMAGGTLQSTVNGVNIGTCTAAAMIHTGNFSGVNPTAENCAP